MIPSSETISTIFSESRVYTIPVFQRTFEWDEDLWEGFFSTLMRKYDSDDPTHLEFMGSVVIKEVNSERNSKYWVIDGQQRLTTIFLTLAALKSFFSIGDDKTNEIDSILFVKKIDGNQSILAKLELSETNYSDFSAVLKNHHCFSNSKIKRCYTFFIDKFEKMQSKLNFDLVLDSILNGLQFIVIKLDKTDKAGYIFETINLTGIHLEPIDTIRNNILGKFDDIDKMNYLYKTFWRDIEAEFNHIGDFPNFLRYFLLKEPEKLKNGFFKPDHLTQAIMDRLSLELKPDSQFNDIGDFLAEMKKYARYYKIITNPNELPPIDKVLKAPFQRLRYLRGTQYMPFLLKVYGLYKDNKKIVVEVILEIIRSIETYYIRRSVCGQNFILAEKMFFDLCSTIPSESNITILNNLKKQIFKELPSDGTFEKNFQKSDFYKSSDFNLITQFILLSIEESKGGMGVHYNPDDKYTIEHIMPQNLTKEWEEHLGRFVNDHEYYVHTIGNLTLVTSQVNCTLYNNYCTFKFEELKKTGFCINNELSCKNQWKISDIEKRAEEFSKIALKIWPGLEGIEFRPLEKNSQLLSLTVKGETYDVTKITPLIELTIKGILSNKQWTLKNLIDNDIEKKLSVVQLEKSDYFFDCGEYGKIYCKKIPKLENAYKFCRNLIESAGWEPNIDWYGVAKKDKIKYQFA